MKYPSDAKERKTKMEWSKLFDSSRTPTLGDIESFLGKGRDDWKTLTAYIESAYNAKPELSYSKCPAQPGWNVKYKKSGKSLCTLYPMEGYFIVLVVVGAKEENEVSMAADAGLFTPYMTELYRRVAFSCGGKWLMIEVRNKTVVEDIKLLLNARVKVKK